ncbi:hypothetical protein BLA29_015142 [Euroglyphus maynei]|uniref:Uncharacterized protein n=1 Tax=Euroglyphus maynei TaxID=6958 RepID=A0A1Y3BR50_EURMA|nr:hypothetical protein BLA29_015142 [Euroglyphus maynei]
MRVWSDPFSPRNDK